MAKLYKHGHNLCFGVFKYTGQAIYMKNKNWFKTGGVLGWFIYWSTGLPKCRR